jgi:hypothetical protein
MMVADIYEFRVERLFREAPDRLEATRRNPVTGGHWVSGLDPVEPQKQAAYRALRAQAWFASKNPGMPPLPLSYKDREDLKGQGGVRYIIALYARSLASLDYDLVSHPCFHTYACGVMASSYTPGFIKNDPDLLERYPPRTLEHLGPGLYFDPAESP